MVIIMKKRYGICLLCFCLCMFLIMSISVDATIQEVLGEKTYTAMIEEIVLEVNRYAKITPEQINIIILDITNMYGINITETQKNSIYEIVTTQMESTLSDKIFFTDYVRMWIADLYRFVDDLPITSDNEVSVTIPRISQVDSIVNLGIYYFVRNILPLIIG